MNEATAQLIEKLATKLGTTAEHLWEVLVRQAPISAITNLTTNAIIIALLVVAILAIVKRTRRLIAEDSDIIPVPIILCIIFAVILGTYVIACVGEMPIKIAGIFNPEYWALKQILH